jgi:hypothetical protein
VTKERSYIGFKPGIVVGPSSPPAFTSGPGSALEPVVVVDEGPSVMARATGVLVSRSETSADLTVVAAASSSELESLSSN